ncbi:GNAT family N-acetyltransferase [Paenibacillus turpanensis]|uniref:GNAT family N-acetyltransferase n=1 Tax=Paenibacillus turpanensis TaxID=2689078 RepID=UPI001407C9C0|nr:GNAT family N-acetyltransferase [Paenibacillus turpanensis]
MTATIRRLKAGESYPWSLLLLADPHREIVESYVSKGSCYVLQQEQEVIGVFVLLPTRPLTVELVNIAVAEAYQGKGYGKKLVLEAVRMARESGYKTIEVGTGNSSIPQLALYQKCGFRIIGVDLNFFQLHYPEPIMENGMVCRDMIRLQQHL